MNLGRLSEKLARRVGLPDDTNPYIYYDLNWICIVPNMDPHINSFEVLKETEEEIIVRTGYEATGQKIHAFPIPDFLKFETDTLKTIVLRKLNAGKGDGYIFQSDHTVSIDISDLNKDYVINLIRKYDRYPLQLGKHDIQDVT